MSTLIRTSPSGPLVNAGTFVVVEGLRVAPAGASVATLTAIALANTAIVQNIINRIGPQGGGYIYFPEGRYYLYPVGIIFSNIHIRGAGRGVTILTMGPSPTVSLDEMFRFGIAAGASTPVAISNCSIGQLTGDGNRAQQVNGTDPAGSNAAIVGVATVVDMTVFDMLITQCDGYGLSFFGTDFANRSDWYVYDVEMSFNNYDGLDIKGGSTNIPSRIDIEACYSHDNSPIGGTIVGRDSVGFDLRGERITIAGCTADNNATSGIRLRDGVDGCYSASVISCYGRGNTGSGLQIDGVASGVYNVEGGVYRNNTQWGIRQESGYSTISGATMSNQLRGFTNFSTACVANLTDCIIQDNTDYGIRVDIAATRFRMQGGCVRRNGLEGCRFGNGYVSLQNVDIIDNSQAAGSHAGVLILSTVARWLLVGCNITNVEGVTQNWAIEFQAGSQPGVLNSYLNGNATAPITGTTPVGTLFYGNANLSVPVVV